MTPMKHTLLITLPIICSLPCGLGGFVYAQTTPEIETRVQAGYTKGISQILLLPDNKSF